MLRERLLRQHHSCCFRYWQHEPTGSLGLAVTALMRIPRLKPGGSSTFRSFIFSFCGSKGSKDFFYSYYCCYCHPCDHCYCSFHCYQSLLCVCFAILLIDLCRLRYLGVLLGVWDHDSVEPVKEAPVKTKGSTKGSKGTKGGSKGGKPGGTSAVHAKAPSCD